MNSLTLNLDIDDFLANYWQKKPLLIRKAFDAFNSPVSAEELAGLACEMDIESRLILEKDGATPWEVRHGPFTEAAFTKLPTSHWTLLVQDVEKHLPELLPLLDIFNFIPAWRLDDLMISYASDQGSVGPHLDAYDVFLIQAQGQRHWSISSQYSEQSPTLNDIDLKILQDFSSDQDWTLQPGDMLYLPPDVAHHGVALGECITCSVGFRAPSINDLVHSYTDHIIQTLNSTQRYADPNRSRQTNPHELEEQDIEILKSLVLRQFSQPQSVIKHWLGSLLTESKENFIPLTPDNLLSRQNFLQHWKKQHWLYRDSRLHFLFTRSNTTIDFYVDSAHHSFIFSDDINPEYICSVLKIAFKTEMAEPLIDVLFQFYRHGYYYFEH